MAEKGILHLSEFTMKQKDGTIFPTEHSVMPLIDDQGEKIGWISVVRDITERKRAEMEHEKLQVQLGPIACFGEAPRSTNCCMPSPAEM